MPNCWERLPQSEGDAGTISKVLCCCGNDPDPDEKIRKDIEHSKNMHHLYSENTILGLYVVFCAYHC